MGEMVKRTPSVRCFELGRLTIGVYAELNLVSDIVLQHLGLEMGIRPRKCNRIK